jgi:tRNA (cytidine/uridine-2'-O-)-methyltransferase
MAQVFEHEDLEACLKRLAGSRVFALTTKAGHSFFAAQFAPGDAFLLGPETRGLPPEVLATFPDEQRLRLPLRPGNRSLNLSNAAAVALYEAWRQQGFAGSA